MRIASSCLVLAVLAGVPAIAAAQPPASTSEVQARAHFAKGKELVTASRFQEALAEFTAGYSLSTRPLFLFNMGECARALADTSRARDYYQRYLAAEPNGAFAQTAHARLTKLPAPVLVSFRPALPVASVIATRQTMPAPATREPSHWRRNTLLVGLGLAVIGGSVAIYMATRDDACGAACVDLR
jgi:tetratricopeptide (TPR) repeat protein